MRSLFTYMFFLTLLTFFLPCNAGEKEEGKRYYAFTPQISSAEGELALLENGKNKKIYALLIRVGTGSFPFLYVKGEEEKIPEACSEVHKIKKHRLEGLQN